MLQMGVFAHCFVPFATCMQGANQTMKELQFFYSNCIPSSNMCHMLQDWCPKLLKLTKIANCFTCDNMM
jgi:hypothetical protein